MKRDIHIFYRHYNVETSESYRPSGFSYQECFRSIMKSMASYEEKRLRDGIQVKLTIVYDSSKGSDNWIFNVKGNCNVIDIKGGSDWESFRQTIEIVDKQDIGENDLIYLLENDYLHKMNWIEKVLELFNTYSNLNYVSLYDHPDKYNHPMYDDLVSKILATKTHHWRTTPSTCGSFIVEKKFFDMDKDILKTMEGDHNKFLWLTQNRKRFVLTPIPSLSTHCMQGLVSNNF
jgi:hypothetical protein